MTTTMRAYVATSPRAHPRWMTIDRPTPAPNEVLVRVHAASINPVDRNYQLMHRLFAVPVHYPMILGNDFAGTVVQLGSAVTGLKIGDAVYGRTPHARTGTFAEYLAISSVAVAKAPVNLNLTAAAAVPLVGLTAYQALHEHLQLRAGQRVLITAGSGGVGSFAIQLARARGAHVITTTSQRHVQLVENLGADEVIDYHQTDFSTELHDLDAAFDTHGHGDAQRMLKVLRPSGRLVTIAGLPPFSFGREQHLDPLRRGLLGAAYLPMSRRVRAARVDYHFLLMHSSGQQLARLTALIEAGQVHPVIDRIFPSTALESALHYAGTGHATGKVVVTMT